MVTLIRSIHYSYIVVVYYYTVVCFLLRSSFYELSGGALGRPCTSSGTANVILFNGGNAQGTITRQLVTNDYSTTSADYISFNIVIGLSNKDSRLKQQLCL